jgi:outer membrane murein-binding lipoprotein Lpp
MDTGTMKDHIEDLMIQINALETNFHTLNAVIAQLQKENDTYRNLWLEAEAALQKLKSHE